MDFAFTQSELYWLDHLMPDAFRRKKEDAAADPEEQKELMAKDEVNMCKY